MDFSQHSDSLESFATGFSDVVSVGLNTIVGDFGYYSSKTQGTEHGAGFTFNPIANPFNRLATAGLIPTPEAMEGMQETMIFDCWR